MVIYKPLDFVFYLKPYKKGLLLALFFTVLFTASNIYFLPLSRDIVQELSNQNLARINNQIFNAILLYAVRLASQYGQLYIMAKISDRIFIDVRVQIYQKLQTLSQAFFSESKTGDLLSRLFNDAAKVKDIIMMTLGEAAPQLFSAVGILVYLFVMNYKLMLFTLITIPMFVWIIGRTSDQLKRLSRRSQRKIADVTHIAQETLGNIKMVQSNTMEAFEVDRFKQENMRSFRASMHIIKVKYRLEPLVSFLQFLVITLILLYGGYQMAHGELSGSNLASFFTGVLLLIDPVLSISRMYSSIQQSLASVERVSEILEQDSFIPNTRTPIVLEKVEGTLCFHHVGFSYPNTVKSVLSDISIEAKQGTVTALVGLSGSGKSTLITLISRFYDVTEGKITLDGHDIRDLDLFALRSLIATVPQEDVLFRGSVLDNIRYGRLDATEDDVKKALQMAHAWEFVDQLSGKMNARIGDRGQKLSGGQKQRLSIARAILRDPKILILDEATSSLDSNSEELVQDALKTLMANRTTFVIAHRLSTIGHAHQILVLEKGMIKESGTHLDLMNQGGLYKTLYSLQFKK